MTGPTPASVAQSEAEAAPLRTAYARSGLTYEKVATATGLSLNTVRNAILGKRYLAGRYNEAEGTKFWPYSPTAAIYATVADAVGATPDEVRATRPDAAIAMRQYADVGAALADFSDEQLLAEIARRMAGQRPGPPRGVAIGPAGTKRRMAPRASSKTK